jgi:endonuclease/exonuclease/phosphatase family metal-dependent hydrolase
MKNIYKPIALLTVFLVAFQLHSQNFNNLNFGSNYTLDIVTWNTEWFPANGTTTVNYVKEIVEAMDAEVIAFQEIDNKSRFQDLINSLDDYDGYYISNDDYQSLAYLYKKSSVQIIDRYEIYQNDWNEFPRSPLILEFNFENKKYVIINNHLKCCGDGFLDPYDNGDEEGRRYWACRMLDSYIEDNFASDRVVVVGDMNDELTDREQDNVFNVFFDDASHYLFADMPIAEGSSSSWSYPTWPSHLDHILITNELFDVFNEVGSSCEVIKVDQYFSSWNTYENNVSDHRPVGIKLQTKEIGIEEVAYESAALCYPNPFQEQLELHSFLAEETIKVYNHLGKLIYQTTSGDKIIETTDWPAGMYLIQSEPSLKTQKMMKVN